MKKIVTAALTLLAAIAVNASGVVSADSIGTLDGECFTMAVEATESDSFSAYIRFSLLQQKSRCSLMIASATDTLEITLSRQIADRFTDWEKHSATVTVSHNGRELHSGPCEGEFGLSDGEYNSLGVTFSRDGLHVSGGYRHNSPLVSVATGYFKPESAGVRATGKVAVADFAMQATRSPETKLQSGHTAASLAADFASSTDGAEGFWSYLDRENDPRYARPGGRYTVALRRNADSSYDIIYISGAEVNGQRWSEGMIKGHLRPTAFKDHFDLEWIDSTFRIHDRDIHASLDSVTGILTLYFPLLKTKIRLSRNTRQP